MAQDPNFGKFTEQELNKLRNRLGKEFPIMLPFIRFINEDSIRHAASGVGDMNPLYSDPDYARKTKFGKLVAPPCLFYAFGWGSQDMRKGQGLPGVHAFHSGDHFYYFRPMVEGDVMHATKQLESLEHKPGNFSSDQYVQVMLMKYYNQNDELVAVDHMPIFRAERGDAKKTGRDKSIAAASYTQEEIDAYFVRMAKEEVRGGNPRYWEDVEIGEAVPELCRGPLCVHDIICWLLGMGSAFLRTGQYWLAAIKENPAVAVPDPKTHVPAPIERVHYDPYMASEIGQPSAYDYGGTRGGWATNFVSNWTSDEGWMAEIEFQFRGFLWHGDCCIISGTITDKWIGAKTGTGYVEMKFETVDQRGRKIMPGRAVVALPSRKNGPLKFPIDVVADGRA